MSVFCSRQIAINGCHIVFFLSLLHLMQSKKKSTNIVSKLLLSENKILFFTFISCFRFLSLTLVVVFSICVESTFYLLLWQKQFFFKVFYFTINLICNQFILSSAIFNILVFCSRQVAINEYHNVFVGLVEFDAIEEKFY